MKTNYMIAMLLLANASMTEAVSLNHKKHHSHKHHHRHGKSAEVGK